MNRFIKSVSNVVTGGAKAFLRYPAAMLSALALAVTATLRVALDYGGFDEKLFNSIQAASVLGAFLGMAVTAFAVSGSRRRVLFPLGNVFAILVAAGTAALLYLPAGDIPDIAMARVIAAAAVSLILFLLILSRRDLDTDYGEILFITLKSFAIAGIYTLVLLGGLNFIAFAVKSLIFEGMSEDIYSHVSIWSAFVGFAFFLGYFPDFSPEDPDDRMEEAKRHPVFIEILLAYVVIPLMAMMTAVLLIWSVRILLVGELPEFRQIASIFSSYAIIGIGLAILTSHYKALTAVWFRRLFPIAAIVFLAFEAYAIYDQVARQGIKTMEYNIILIGLYALIGSILLLLRSDAAHRFIGWTAALLIVVAMLPYAGYSDAPAWAQGNRLAHVLRSNAMLAGDAIQKAPATISQEDRETITDAADFLFQSEASTKPAWFTSVYTRYDDFQTVFGFARTWPDSGPIDQPTVRSVYLQLPAGSVSLTDYDYAITIGDVWVDAQAVTVAAVKGTYEIETSGFKRSGAPKVEVRLDGRSVLEKDLSDWLGTLAEKYADAVNSKISNPVAYEDMVFRTEAGGVRLMLVFESVETTYNSSADKPEFFLTLSAIYLGD